MRRESEVRVKRDPQDAWITIKRKSSVLQGDRRMSVGLVCVGSKESYRRFGKRDGQAPFAGPLHHLCGVGRKGTGRSRDVRRRERVGKVVSIRGRKLRGRGIRRNEEVKEDR